MAQMRVRHVLPHHALHGLGFGLVIERRTGTVRHDDVDVFRADGNAGDDVSLTEVDLYVRSLHLLAAPDGGWLLSTYADDGQVSYWLLDGGGHVRVERRNGPFAYLLQATAAGFLASEPIGADSLGAVLLDPATLATSARPYRGSGDWPSRWFLLDDGSLYGAIWLPQRGGYRGRRALFRAGHDAVGRDLPLRHGLNGTTSRKQGRLAAALALGAEREDLSRRSRWRRSRRSGWTAAP